MLTDGNSKINIISVFIDYISKDKDYFSINN